jgi:hypothetical protein
MLGEQDRFGLLSDMLALNKAGLLAIGPLMQTIQALKDDGSLWISYPKGTSKMETDINRDIIWKIGEGLGLKPVAMISIDPIWAAFRLKKAF